MSSKLISLTLFVLAVLSSSTPGFSQPVTYFYQGAPFTSATGTYTEQDRVTGSFTLAVPLAPNLAGADLSGNLLSCFFSDGVQRRTCDNSDLSAFAVWTDEAGNILYWDIRLTSKPLGSALGDLNDFIGTWGYRGITDEGAEVSGVNDGGGLAAPCTFVPADKCWAWGSSADSGQSDAEGDGWWVSQSAPVRDFPTAVQGAGSQTEVFFFADTTVSEAPVFVDFLSAEDGQLIERRTGSVTGGQVGSFVFDSTDDLVIGHVNFFAPPTVYSTEMIRLNLPGSGDVPPIGLNTSTPCSRPVALLVRDSRFDTGLALSSGQASEVTCEYQIFEGSDGEPVRDGEIVLSPYSQEQEFTLGDLPEGRYNIQFDCDHAVNGVSLFQESATGALFLNALQCADR